MWNLGESVLILRSGRKGLVGWETGEQCEQRCFGLSGLFWFLWSIHVRWWVRMQLRRTGNARATHWGLIQFGGSGRTGVFVQGSSVDMRCTGKRTGAAVSSGSACSLK